MTKKYLAFLVLMIAVAGVTSGCGKKPVKNNNQNQVATTTEEIASTTNNQIATTTEINISDWLTYKNKEYGFELKYPKGWYWIDESEKWKEYRKNLGEPERKYFLIVKDAKEKLEGMEYEYVIKVDFGKIKEKNIEVYIKKVLGSRINMFSGYLKSETVKGYLLYRYDNFPDMVDHDERYIQCNNMIIYLSTSFGLSRDYMDKIIDTINCKKDTVK